MNYQHRPGRLGRGRNANIKKHLPIIGNLSIGLPPDPAKGVKYPRSINYFRAKGDYADAFRLQYGDKPTSIVVAFESDDPGLVCNHHYSIREGKTLLAEGDGITWERAWSFEHNRYLENYVMQAESMRDDPVIGPLTNVAKVSVVEELTMRLLLPDVKSGLGVWKFTTRGKASSIPSLTSSFDEICEATGGRIAGIPFDFSVAIHEAVMPDKQKKRYPVLKLVANLTVGHLEKVKQMAEHNPLIRKRLQMLSPQKIDQEYQAFLERKQQPQIGPAPGDSEQNEAEWADAEVVEPGEGDPSSMTEEERNLYRQ